MIGFQTEVRISRKLVNKIFTYLENSLDYIPLQRNLWGQTFEILWNKFLMNTEDQPNCPNERALTLTLKLDGNCLRWTIGSAKSVLFWHKWTISVPLIIINNPEYTLMRAYMKLVTKQIYNFGIVNYNPWCTYPPLVPKQKTFMLV